MSRARIVVHYSRMHFVRLCSCFKVQTNADIPARVRLTGKVWLTPPKRTTEGALFIIGTLVVVFIVTKSTDRYKFRHPFNCFNFSNTI